MTATSDVYDAHGESLQSVSVQLRNFGGSDEFDGLVRTIRCFRDNGLIKELLATPGDGAVLVADGGGSLESALLGDLIAASAIANGWAGVVIVGAVRDSAALANLPLGVKALGTNPRKSSKAGVGDVDVEITLGDVIVAPGRHIWCDRDGILVER